MTDIKSYLIDFAEGRVKVPDFVEQCRQDPEILDFLTKIADPKFKTVITHKYTDENGFLKYRGEELPFDAKVELEQFLNGGGGMLGNYLNIHFHFSQVITCAFPDDHIVIDQTLHDRFVFMLNACPEYIGGVEVDDLLAELLDSLPEDLSKTKRIKLYKEKLKSAFHIEPNKYPRWIQAAEWPMGEDGVPMKFVSQKSKNKKAYGMMLYTEFLFEDVKTGEQRTIAQFT